MAVLRVYWRTIKHINLQGYIYVWSNFLWILLTLPIITAPAAWAGLAHLSHKAQTQPRVSVEDFWEGFKKHFKHSLIIGTITLIILVINLTNILSYAVYTDVLTSAMRIVWIVAILVWLSIQLYLWQILEEMENPSLWGAVRNSAVMVLQNPLFTLGLWIGIIPFLILSTVFFPMWFLLTGSSISALATTAVLDRLRAAGHHNPAHHPFDVPP